MGCALRLLVIALLSGISVPVIEPVPHPDLAAVDPVVREQIETQRKLLEIVLEDESAEAAARAKAFGKLGMLYHVYEFPGPAGSCYRNASLLAPDRFRWPFLLGHVHREVGDLERAAESFEQALALDPLRVAALVVQAETLRELDRSERAARLFRRALEQDAGCVSAMFGLGQIELSRRNHVGAAAWFRSALEHKPADPLIHYNLGMSYRGIPDLERAREHLDLAMEGRLPHGFDPSMYDLTDPVLRELHALASGRLLHRGQGSIALELGRYEAAAAEFRKALELDHDDVTSRIGLGHALEALGDEQGAIVQIREALRREPEHAEASARLGRLLALQGTLEEALVHYTRAVESGAADPPTRFWRAMTLARTGRYSEARNELETTLELVPGNPQVVNALARILASAPGTGVRDGERAVTMMRQLATSHPLSPAQAQTMAMALAETGRLGPAARIQKRLLAEAELMGLTDLLPVLREDLDRYRGGFPCRRPWPQDDPSLIPGPLSSGP